MVRDTLVDICFRSGISAGKEVDIGLDEGHDKKLRPANMLLYSWDGGLNVCVDLTGSSLLTQTGMMSDFAPDIGYGFLPFSFSFLGELETDAVTLLKRIRNFSMAQDIRGRAAGHIFNRIGVSIAKGVGAQIVSRLPSNTLLAFFLHAWYLDDDTIVGDTVIVRKVLKLIMEDGSGCGLHLNVDKTKVFWSKEDPRSRLAGSFPPNIARPLHGVKLLGGPASVDFNFCNELVMKRVAKTIELMDAIAKINDPQCELLLLCTCAGISRLYFTMRTCLPRVFASAQRSFDVALRSFLERISVGLQTKLLRHTGIDSPGLIFDDVLSMLNTSMETDLLNNQSEIAVLKLMKKMTDIYFTRVTKKAEIIGIKHHHNVVRDTLVDICYRSGISAGLDVCVDLTGSSPLTQTGMVDLVPGRAVIDVAQCKRDKYMAKCADIGYGFLPFSLSSLGGIRGRRGYIAEADPEVLHDSGHWGTCCCSYI
ncbi:hypothetical protein Tco_1344303 [Tanacetum coccineum]